MSVAVTCALCGAVTQRAVSHVNRSRRLGMQIYCNRTCASMAKRVEKTVDQKKAEKAAYDRQYRARDPDVRKAKKAAYYKATRDPEKERAIRAQKMPQHVEYCRRPEYRAWKRAYDRRHRAKAFGEFADAWLTLTDIDREVNARMSRNELYATKGTQNKKLNRRREYERAIRHDA